MISKYIALLEPLGVFAMIVAYIWRWRYRHPLSWIVILGFVLVSHALRRETPASLGFRVANLKSALAAIAPAVLTVALALLAIGAIFHTIRPVELKSACSSLALYCVWGLFQQYLLNGYFLNRFVKVSPAYAPLIAAIAFSGIHTPNWFLIMVTFFAGFACAKIYLKFRNLYVLGLAHGVIGFLLYLCVPDTISHHLYVGPKWFA
jgi:Type II CAAX prenyl endopeptidase Rce1-like